MPEPRRERRRLSGGEWILLALAAVVVAAVVAFWWWQRTATPSAAAPPAPASAPPEVAAPPPAGPAPVVDAQRVRSLLESLSASALFRSWLAQGDLVRRWVVVTDNLAEGVTPRKQLAFLAPSRPFSVVDLGKRTVIAPESYRRYDGFADAVASIDAPALAKAYRELHPVLEAAYRALGYPGATLDRVTAKALGRIATAPVKEGEVDVVAQGGIFVFADPRLEQLGQVEKHLLRVGPRNTRILQAKAREIGQALGLAADAEAAGKRR